MTAIPYISMTALIERYDVLLFDAFGVLVHNKGALPGAEALIRQLNQLGKPYYILTNDAAKLPATAARRYQGYGLAISPDQVITSGSLLKRFFAVRQLSGARCAVLGPEDAKRDVELAGGVVVPADTAFDVLVVADETGFPFLETVDAALTSLFKALDQKRQIHLVLPNPDLIFPHANQAFGFGAGSVAAMFEGALQLRYPGRSELRFARLGKPEPAIFEEALARSGNSDMVMVGDQLETDIRGARAFGIDAVLIATGVSTEGINRQPPDLKPTYRLRSLLA